MTLNDDQKSLYPTGPALAVDVLARGLAGQPLRLRVSSDSMRPLLRQGDFVFVRPVEVADLCRGDVIVIRRVGDLVTHRLVWASSLPWRTKGDRYRRLDPPLDLDAILGRVIAIQRGKRFIDLSSTEWLRASRWLGRLGWREGLASGKLTAGPYRLACWAILALMLCQKANSPPKCLANYPK